MQGQDALDTLLEVHAGRILPEPALTLTTRMGSIAGTLSDAGGQPMVDYTIILFAADRS